MMLKGLLVLGAVFALSNAFPWRYSNLFHAEQQSHEVARTTSVRDSICKTIDGPTGGISLQPTEVYVCDFVPDVCVYLASGSERRPCCRSLTITGERIQSELTERVTVGGTEYFVRFYVESQGSCYDVKEVVSGDPAPFCVSDTRCQPGCVDVPNPVCEIGVDSCVDGVCTCLDGYAGPDCCDCDLVAGFYRNTTTGECLPCPCCTFGTVDGNIQCSEAGCNCAEGYEGFSCCNCTDGFFRPEDSNECSPPCDTGVDFCVDGVCTCLEGFTGPDCCECDVTAGFYRPVDSDECLPCNCCTDGTQGGLNTCDASGMCTCATGFQGDKCCNTTCEIGVMSCSNGVCVCREGYAQPDCCNCEPGFFRPDGTMECRPPCDTGVDSCVNGVCTCLEGYTGLDCCDCDINGGFYRPIDSDECPPCMCCVDGTDDSSITCDATGDCGGCATGFFGDKCCDPCECCSIGTVGGTDVCDNEDGTCTCATGYTGDKCCNCTDGFYRPPGTQECLPPCDTGVDSCVDGVCTCLEGFTGPDCCICDVTAGFYRPVDSDQCPPCECCIDGTDDGSITCDATGNCGPCRNGYSGDKCCDVTRPCSTDTDFYFLVDTTRSYDNDDLCLQTYTMMEIVAALDLGTGEDESLVGTILYPDANPNQDTPATYLNQLGDPNVDDCPETVQRLEELQIDIFRGIFESPRRYTPIYATRGDRTLPQNAISLLAEALDNRPLTDRRIAGVVLTDGEHDQTSLSLEAARNLLPAELDLIAAGVGETAEDRDALMDDLQIIAGNPNNIIIADSIPDLAESVITLLIRKGIICPDDGQAILNRIATNNFINAQRYCTCLQNRYNGVGCTSTLVRPACPAPTLAKIMHGKVKNEDALEEEILAAVENVLKHHGH